METTEAQYLAFVEEARVATSKALVKLAIGQRDAAVEILEAFSQKCGGIVGQAALLGDQQALQADRFDLGALKVDLRSDAPEREED